MNLVVSPYIAAFLKQGFISLRTRWSMRYKMYISITASQSAGIIEVKYLDRKGDDMLHPNYICRRKLKQAKSEKPTPKERKGQSGKSRKREKRSSTEPKDKKSRV